MPTEEEKFQIDECRIVLGDGGLVVGNYKSDGNPCKGSKMTTGDNLVKVINMEVQHELLFTGDLADQIADSNGCCTITALITDINSKITVNSGDLKGEQDRATVAEEQIAKDLVAAEEQIAKDLKEAEDKLTTQINNILSNVDPTALDSLTEIVTEFQNADANLNNAITTIASEGSQRLDDLNTDLGIEQERATVAEEQIAKDLEAAEAKITTSASDNLKPFVGYSELAPNTLVKIIQDYTKYLKLVQISDTEIATLCLRDNDEGDPLDGIKYGDYESKCIHYISGPKKN